MTDFKRGFTAGFPHLPMVQDKHLKIIQAMDKGDMAIFLQQVKMAHNWFDIEQALNHQSLRQRKPTK